MGNIGEQHDRVTLTLAGETVLLATTYEIVQSIIAQPSAFALRMGSDDEARRLKDKYPPGTPFALAIDGVTQFTGVTDGYVLSGATGGTQVNVRGRDTLAFLHGARARSDRSFSDITYSELVEQVLKIADPAKSWNLLYSNAANRKAVSKAPSTGEQQVTTAQDAAVGALPGETITEELAQDATARAPSQQARTLRIKAGQPWYAWLKAELDRAGLMLWADANGNFVLSAPDTTQPASVRIYRKRGATRNLVTVVSATYRNETTERFSECIVHMRRGGGAEPRARGFGSYVDTEMGAWGFDRPLVVADAKCKTLAQADILARRKIAESRRQQRVLQYTVAGHTTEGLAGGRVIWTPDTVVEVDDDEFGLHSLFYVESVTKSRNPETRTELTLLHVEDVIYGEDPEEAA